MLAKQRRDYIQEVVGREGAVRVADLVDQLGVSDMTIRRDLAALANAGLVEKVHGGATRIADGASHEPAFATKAAMQREAKRAIATAAAGLVEPQMAIGMSAGTTTHAIADRLVDVPGLTVVTNSMHIGRTLHESGRDDQTLILTGGVPTPSDALVGPFAVATLRQVHLDLVFMGVHGMSLEAGFTTPNMLEAETNQALAAAGRCLVVVADHTKWGLVGMSSIAGLREAAIVITDDAIEPEVASRIEERVGELIIASTADVLRQPVG